MPPRPAPPGARPCRDRMGAHAVGRPDGDAHGEEGEERRDEVGARVDRLESSPRLSVARPVASLRAIRTHAAATETSARPPLLDHSPKCSRLATARTLLFVVRGLCQASADGPRDAGTARGRTAEPTEARPRRRSRTALSSRLGRLFQPVDGASLAVFRILFGAIMVWEVYRYFSNDWIQRYWVEPSFHFTYPRVRLGRALPGRWMEVAVRVARSVGRLHRARALLPRRRRALLRRLHLHVPARAGAVPPTISTSCACSRSCSDRARPPRLVGGCDAQQAAMAGDRADLVAVAAACPDRGRLHLCRGGEAERRLAPRRAAPHVAGCANRLRDHRPLLHRGVGALALQLRRPALRPDRDSRC